MQTQKILNAKAGLLDLGQEKSRMGLQTCLGAKNLEAAELLMEIHKGHIMLRSRTALVSEERSLTLPAGQNHMTSSQASEPGLSSDRTSLSKCSHGSYPPCVARFCLLEPVGCREQTQAPPAFLTQRGRKFKKWENGKNLLLSSGQGQAV